MKSKFLRAIVIVMAVILTTAFAACSPEVIYYLDNTERVLGNAPKGNTSSGSQSGSQSGTITEPDDYKGDGSTYDLRVWCAEEDVAIIWEMLYDYADKYSANTYNWTVEKQGEDIVSASVVRDVEAAADVFSFANDQIGTLKKADALTPIPAAYTSQIESQIDIAIGASKVDGDYYAFPYSYENCFLYYNKSLVSENNIGSLEGLLDANIPGVTYNLGIDMSDSYYTTMFLYTAGVTILGANGDDPTDVHLNTDEAKLACKYIQALGGKTKLGSIPKDSQYASLKNGKVAAMISGPHMIYQFKEALGENFGVAVLPTVKMSGDTATGMWCFSGVKMYGVSRKGTDVRSAETTAEAIKLASFLANKSNQQKRLDEKELCPTDEDLFNEAVESGIKTVEVVVDQAERSRLKPGLIEMTNYWPNMSPFLLGVYKQNYSESEWAGELVKIEDKIKGN